ncbi:MAG: deoxyribose-phosphate aldolase [Acidimicrobiales bacterium]
MSTSRTIRFEADAAGPADAIETLRLFPPGTLGEVSVEAVESVEGTAVVVVAPGRLRVREGDRPNEVEVEVESWSADASALRATFDALCTLVADPERRRIHSGGPSGTTSNDRAGSLAASLPEGVERVADLRMAVRCIDLTTLEGDDTPGRVRALCATALRPDPADPTVGPTAAVCIHPSLVSLAAELTEESDVRVASVGGAFPTGLSSLDVRVADVVSARADGADEIDIVLNRSAFLSGDHELAERELRSQIEAAGGAHVKVIIEVGELSTDDAIATATRMAIAAGAHTVKTSTGKTAVNATPRAVLVMAEELAKHHADTGEVVGIKIAGGVRTADDALGYLAIVRHTLGQAWIDPTRFRFGASSLLGAVVAELAMVEDR